MGFFDKIFRNEKKEQKPISSLKQKKENSSSDTIFVENFIAKGGKFLYCLNREELMGYLKSIFDENNWNTTYCLDDDLKKNLNVLDLKNEEKAGVFYTKCEHLIVEDGSILFSSNQLKETKLIHYPNNFIVFATTSQLILDKDKALTSIKYRFDKEIPSNISAIKDYLPKKKDPNFLNYGNTNSKNLYLLLLEDL